jgi:uncharacterized protein YwgA
MDDEKRRGKLVAINNELHLLKEGLAYENTVKMQSAVCLLQMMGVEMGYDDYFISVRGPFSKKLSNDYHSIWPKTMSGESTQQRTERILTQGKR